MKFIKWNASQIPVRKAENIFHQCFCDGCQIMDRNQRGAVYGSGKFMVGLLFHNYRIFTRIVDRIINEPQGFAKDFFPRFLARKNAKIPSEMSANSKTVKPTMPEYDFTTAHDLNRVRREYGESAEIHRDRLERCEGLGTPPKSILVINHCSKFKTRKQSNGLKKFVGSRTANYIENLMLAMKSPEFSHLKIKAEDLYRSSSNDIVKKSLVRVSAGPKSGSGISIDYCFFSTAYGLISSKQPILPYDLTFSQMTESQILHAKELHSMNISEIMTGDYDLVISVMSSVYQAIFADIVHELDITPVEWVWFDREDRFSKQWEHYSIPAFGNWVRRNKLTRILGRRWNQRANILHNYLYHCSESSFRSFFDFWHGLYDCNCPPRLSGFRNNHSRSFL